MNNSVLNSDKTIESIATMTDDKQTNYMLQRMISDYLAKLQLPSMEEILKKTNQVEEPGVLTETHIKLLQCMVKDYYKVSGGSIEISAKQKGITLKEGTLSKLEEECVDKLLADYCRTIKNLLDNAENEN
jgi:hypothetical protein